MGNGQRKLLLIDDDTLVRESLAAYLEDSGFYVIEADDGAKGLALFEKTSPDLVLSDLRMPGMDGLNVLQEIHKRDSEIPVIVISGAGVMGDVVEALRLGASDYLIKPIVDMEVLVHSIDKTLERHDLLLENQRYREKLEKANRNLRDHLRVLERDQRAGRLVQERLLPMSPMHRLQYTAAQQIIPSLYLSGDFIDYAFLSERYLAFYLTDVAGHGASSAFVTVWLKHLVTRMVRDNGFFSDESTFEEGPGWMMREINGALRGGHFETHLTCFIGVVDTHTHQMRYAVGGHLPLPVLKTETEVRYLEGKGKPVGIFGNVEWQVFSAEFSPKSTLVVFSDGVLDTLAPSSLIEKERALLNVVGETDGSIESLSRVLGLEESSVANMPDDVSILTIARNH
ncbi:response regulator [Marinibactrum halimedae]|uniref:Fused response regulator/phosphatase n=1 Tax=Marinibactrum halimedae TaxID=1444977 RepID=A0AA37T6F6_9GAMM|nr:response regulator [Marinibactrum halimedae]MCD9460770.1 response regulator [Marinibactrum halimedae]GLS26656.1 fused response regulator/phosphatase [Marinibactrum halimedae]